ncbi:MAG TPA: hypothetical protein EYO61_00525 [Campylobacterales bacterium]|nr:hypothetical protein [Campylobacterales bacterium]
MSISRYTKIAIFTTIVLLIGIFGVSIYYSSRTQEANKIYSKSLILKTFSYRVGIDVKRYRQFGITPQMNIKYSYIFRKDITALLEGVNSLADDFREAGILDGVQYRFENIRKLLEQYAQSFEQLVEKREEIGDSQKGIIHQIESHKSKFLSYIEKWQIFQFRDEFLKLVIDEQNFRIYRKIEYKDNFDKRYRKLVKKIENNHILSSKSKDLLLQTLANYKGYFSEFYDTTSLVGLLNPTNGTIGEMEKELYSIQIEIDNLIKRAKRYRNKMKEKLEKKATVIVIILAILLIATLVVILKTLEKSIRNLELSLLNLGIGERKIVVDSRIDMRKVKPLSNIANLINMLLNNIEEYLNTISNRDSHYQTILGKLHKTALDIRQDSESIATIIGEQENKILENIGQCNPQIDSYSRLVVNLNEKLVNLKKDISSSSVYINTIHSSIIDTSKSIMEISNNFDNSKKSFTDVLNLLEELEGVAQKTSDKELAENIYLLKKSIRDIVISIKSIRDTTSSALITINNNMLDTIGQFSNINITKHQYGEIERDIESLKYLENSFKQMINHIYKLVETNNQEILQKVDLLNREVGECYKEIGEIERGFISIHKGE